MKENFMHKVRKILEVGFKEKFIIDDSNRHEADEFYIDDTGLYNTEDNLYYPQFLMELLNGTAQLQKLPWKPVKNTLYYYVCPDGRINYTFFDEMPLDLYFWAMNNCFRTEEIAMAHRDEVLEQYARIKKDLNLKD